MELTSITYATNYNKMKKMIVTIKTHEPFF